MWLSCDHHYQVITAGVCNEWKHESVIYRKCWKICLRKTTHHQWSMISSFSLQASHIIRLVPTSPSINMSLRGEVNYRDHLSTQQRLFLDLNTALTLEASWYSTIESACVYESLHVRRWGCDCVTTFTPPPHQASFHSSSEGEVNYLRDHLSWLQLCSRTETLHGVCIWHLRKLIV